MGEDDPRITPEKQLLKLIEDPKAEDIDSARTDYNSKKGFSLSFLTSLIPAGKGLGEFFSGKKELLLDIRGINWILKLGILGAAAYLVIYLTVASQGAKMPLALFEIPSETQGAIEIKEIKSGLQPFSYYGDTAEERDMFNPYSDEEEVEEETKEEPKEKELSEEAGAFLNNLRLVGIAYSDQPDVIIENTSIQRTFFLKTGDIFMEAQVKEIFPDRVIVEYQGEQTELR